MAEGMVMGGLYEVGVTFGRVMVIPVSPHIRLERGSRKKSNVTWSSLLHLTLAGHD